MSSLGLLLLGIASTKPTTISKLELDYASSVGVLHVVIVREIRQPRHMSHFRNTIFLMPMTNQTQHPFFLPLLESARYTTSLDDNDACLARSGNVDPLDRCFSLSFSHGCCLVGFVVVDFMGTTPRSQQQSTRTLASLWPSSNSRWYYNDDRTCSTHWQCSGRTSHDGRRSG